MQQAIDFKKILFPQLGFCLRQRRVIIGDVPTEFMEFVDSIMYGLFVHCLQALY